MIKFFNENMEFVYVVLLGFISLGSFITSVYTIDKYQISQARCGVLIKTVENLIKEKQNLQWQLFEASKIIEDSGRVGPPNWEPDFKKKKEEIKT